MYDYIYQYMCVNKLRLLLKKLYLSIIIPNNNVLIYIFYFVITNYVHYTVYTITSAEIKIKIIIKYRFIKIKKYILKVFLLWIMNNY